jgi:ribosomal protein S18 acetylase RimI-like enzyme
MNRATAKSISSLINNQNQLSSEITPATILEEKHQYLYEFDDNGEIIVCLQLRKNIWYQYEIKYVSTSEKYQRQGYASSLIQKAEKEAGKMGCRILQCAIREDNVRSIGLFKKMGFFKVSQFFNPYSGHNFGVWHKVLEPWAGRIDTP